MQRRSFMLGALALASAPSQAQDSPWPSRPVKIFCPFPPGGASDFMARLAAESLSKEFGQQFIVENIPGAGGTIGMARAAKSVADGYSLVLTGVGSNAVVHGLDLKLGYDSTKDFIHIGQIHSGPNVLVVHPDQPFKTLYDLLAHVRKNPGKLNYGYTHAASGHMAMELLKQQGGVDGQPLFIVGIPYRGAGPLLSDLLGGQVPMVFVNQDTALPHVRAGKLRALAVTSKQRNPLYPDVPTIAESGIPDYEALSWSGLSAVKGTPQPIVARLEAALKKTMAAPETRQRLESVGFVVPPAGAAAYTKFVQSEIDLWTKVIRTANIKPG